MNLPPRINVLGVGISILTLDSAADFVIRAIEGGRQGYVTVTGVHGVSECQHDAELCRIHNESLLSTPDGVPLTWMGRLQGVDSVRMSRVYGPDLMLRVLDRGRAEDLRHFFFGGREGVAELLREKLSMRFPGTQIVGTYSPPFRPLNDAEELQLLEELNRTKPNCFWVGLSTPKQERIMADLLARYGNEATDAPAHLPSPLVMFGVGAAFDFHAGLMAQAPSWMQAAGLEWLFRLWKEPRRLAKRYCKNNPTFLVRAALQLTGLRTYKLPEKMAE